jgi:hypothetical protein
MTPSGRLTALTDISATSPRVNKTDFNFPIYVFPELKSYILPESGKMSDVESGKM